MSISFACPGCRVQIEVADEHAGESGQCPRCQRVVVIPSPTKPMPLATTAETVPPADPWAEPREKPRSKPRPADTDEARPRRSRAAAEPKKPMGPIWPWIVGVFGAIIVASLLFSSLLVLVLWRRAEPTRPPQVVEIKQPEQQIKATVTVGRLEGNRAFLQNGVFQIRSDLNQNDRFDPDLPRSRCKRIEIELVGNRDYVVEMESNQFDCEVRLETINENVLRMDNGQRGFRAARIDHFVPRQELLVIYATSLDPAFGAFTLTVREANRPKPFVP